MSRHFGRKKISIVIAGLFLLGAGGGTVWLLTLHKPAAVDPFDAKTLASVDFPLYYPLQIPKGFRTDPKSVTEPQSGVVVFDMKDSKGRKIFVSEEARSSTYNYGGFFNGIERSSQFKAQFGAAITGYLNNEQNVVGSIVSQKTWVIVNAKAGDTSPAQLKTIIATLAASH